MPFCKIIIQSHPNPLNPPSESNLKCVEDYIRLRASQIDGFHAKSFNIQFNEKFNQLKCKYNEPVKYKNEINPVKVRSFNKISIYFKNKCPSI